MSSKFLGILVVVLFIIILAMLALLIILPGRSAPSPAPAATTTPAVSHTPPAPAQPLSARVLVSSPRENATVGQTFSVEGKAPGSWFFEAQFPMQVRDAQDNVIGRATGSAQGEWQTEKLVTFKATMHIDESYHGPATLILMKDNPSGLPENDDSVTVSIVVQ